MSTNVEDLLPEILETDDCNDCFPVVSEAAKLAIGRGIDRGDCVIELEAIGLTCRTVNALEESEFKIITVEDLMSHPKEDLMVIENIGVQALTDIFTCLANYEKLEKFLENET